MHTKITNQKRIVVSMALVAITLSAKLFFAFKTNSLALFSDSWHLFTDLASLIVSLWGLTIATKPADLRHTFGHYRHSVLAALINNVTLFLVSFVILYTAFNRYFHFGIAHSTVQIEHTACGSCFHRAHGSSQCTMCIDSAQEYAVKDLCYIKQERLYI